VETIDIWIADPNYRDAHVSLLNWLNDNKYIKDNARLIVKPPAPGATMGGGLDVIQLSLNDGFNLANLVFAIVKWREERKERKEAAPEVSVKAGDERPTVLSPDDLGNANLVRRALAGAPDPQKSSCVLIGVSDYSRLPRLQAVKQNVLQLEKALKDPAIWGIPSDRVHNVPYPHRAAAIREAISAAKSEATDTLLVYYAGHGLYDKDKKLLLALPEATGKDTEETISWKELAELIRNANCNRRVVWLDCCYAGLAVPDKETPDQEPPPDLLGVAKVDAIYMLVAAEWHEEARAPEGEECTAFTSELLSVLRNGIAPGPPAQEFLNLNDIHQKTRDALRKKHRPEPGRHDPGSIGHLPHFQNNATVPNSPRGNRPVSARSLRLPSLPFRYVIVGGLAVLIALVAALLATHLSGPGLSPQPTASPSLTALGGENQTGYCQSQGQKGGQAFVVADSGTECVQKIKLDEACDWSFFPETNLKLVLANTADPDSGTCYNAKNIPIGNINNMPGYCGTRTAAADVTATPSDSNFMNTWVCEMKLGPHDVCAYTYPKTSHVVARKVGGSWVCYEENAG
jgi:Effector Associated Constant Component 1/Caspase domain